MRIIIAGGSGFIGQELSLHYLNRGYEVILIGRSQEKIASIFGNRVESIRWDEFQEKASDILLSSDVMINLAGANIASKRWSAKQKQEILDSRISTTQLLAQACAELGTNSPPLFNASAVGIYGSQNQLSSSPANEATSINFEQSSDFLSKVARSWEKATIVASNQSVRVVNLRFGLALGKGGLLKKLRLPYILGMGGPIGTGVQPFPWISIDDLINAVDFLIKTKTISGPVNIVSPQLITQKQFADAYAKVLHRPSKIKTPKFAVQLLFGEMGEELLLTGPVAYPQVLLDHHFTFQFTDILSALKQAAM